MANTIIQLKYSEATSAPASLNVAEPAYSNNSNKLFIGLAGNQVVAVGGKYYTDIVDAATDANTVSTIVKRDTSGSFSATAVKASLFGNANTATAWQTSRTIGVSGDANGTVSIDGSANANIPLTLGNSGVAAGTYGGTTNIPTFSVDAKGRITSAANVSISSTLNIAGDTGTDAVALATDTITFVGGDGITTTAYSANSNVKFDVDNTVIRTTGQQTITGNLTISGNLVISGNTITADIDTIAIHDPLIQLAANNEVSDSLDIGFYGHYSDDGGTSKRHTGLFRDTSAADKRYVLFTNLLDVDLDSGSATTVNVAQSSFAIANLQSNIVGGKISGLSQAIAVADGGTGNTTFTAGQILIGNGTGALTVLANTGTAGTYANASHVPIITTDAYGRVSSITNTAIALDAAAITSGLLPINRGGTNQALYTTGALLQFDGTSITSIANTGTAATYANASHVPVITTDAYGRVSSVVNTAIAIDAAAITSGTLGVARGGTGNTSFTNNGVIIGQGSSALTTVVSSTEGHVLQINASGVPTFAHLNGGSF
jgi:hypothetical protein